MRDNRPTLMERAYQLARSGKVSGPAEIKDQLSAEGYSDVIAHISGPTLLADLRRLCDAAGR
jgi:hypothetical protein